jgi:hypothetical protein
LHNSIQKVQKVVVVEERSGRNGWVGMVRKEWLRRTGCGGMVGAENAGRMVAEMLAEEW